MYQQLVAIPLPLMIYLEGSSKSNFLIPVRYYSLENKFLKIFSVEWIETDQPFNEREHLKGKFFPKTLEIHWLSVINSVVLGIWFTLFVSHLDLDLICLLDQIYIFESIWKTWVHQRRKPWIKVVLLTGFIVIILMRVLKNDFSRYNKEDEAIDSEMVNSLWIPLNS